jgi:O-antigen biosynthesis protein
MGFVQERTVPKGKSFTDEVARVGAWSPNHATASDPEESAEPTNSQRLINVLETTLQCQGEHLARLQIELNKILTSDGWRLLSRYYSVRNRLLPLGSRRYAAARVLLQGIRWLPQALRKARTSPESLRRDYSQWIAKNEPSAEQLEQQRREEFPFQPLVSIVVPVFQPPPDFLAAMIDSVLAQTYTNWELCIADGQSRDPEVGRILRDYAQRDSRIRVEILPENKGIAGNSNAALALANGAVIALLDHDDTLAPFALFEVVRSLNQHPDADFLYSDEDLLDEKGLRHGAHFKPDWSPDTLRSHNFIGHFVALGRELVKSIGGFREGFDGSQDYDLVLRATEQARQVLHIPQVLYHWRKHPGSFTGGQRLKDAHVAARQAILEHLRRADVVGTVLHGNTGGTYQVVRSLPAKPLVSIMIPSKDHHEVLDRCLKSIAPSTYSNYEIIVVDNNSQERETFDYYKTLSDWPKLRMVKWDHPFNYGAMNNFAANQAAGEVLLLLNNDTETRCPDWLERMLEHTLRPEVGAVGAKLYYPDGTIQHGGVILGIGGVAGHAHRYVPGQSPGYVNRLVVTQNVSAVTGACLMIRKQVFEEIGGFDERFVVNLNDVDLCMRIRQRGYWIVWTPHAELYHHERKTRGADDTQVKRDGAADELQLFLGKWWEKLHAGDPFYSPHLSLENEDFSLRL